MVATLVLRRLTCCRLHTSFRFWGQAKWESTYIKSACSTQRCSALVVCSLGLTHLSSRLHSTTLTLQGLVSRRSWVCTRALTTKTSSAASLPTHGVSLPDRTITTIALRHAALTVDTS